MYKHQEPQNIPVVRQEGFHLPTPPPFSHSGTDTSNHDSSNSSSSHHSTTGSSVFGLGHSVFHPGNLDLDSELVSLIHSGNNNEGGPPNPGTGDFRPSSVGSYHSPPHTHNIFDISAPPLHHGHSYGHHMQGSGSGAGSFPSQFSLPSASTTNGNGQNNGRDSSSPPDGPLTRHYNFNSTLPALNSSMRYDPHPPSANGLPGTTFASTPSSYHSPSPHRHSQSRSRSRSRPPSSHLSVGSVGPGPTRNSRSRRTDSFGAGSPPPHHRPVPGAIVIPGGAVTPRPSSSASYSWFSGTPGSDFLPSGHSPVDPASHPSLPSLSSSIHSPNSSYLDGSSYGSPVETKFGGLGIGMGLNGMTNLNLDIGDGVPGSFGSLNGMAVHDVAQETKQEPKESKAALIANEKRRRRRESHNAVERRRRDNINERISELATLIPECLLEVGPGSKQDGDEDGKDVAVASPASNGNMEGMTTGKDGVVKANKGMVLRKSVEYIRYLQQLVTAQGARNRELEQQLQGFRGGSDDDGATLDDFPSGLGDGGWVQSLASMPEDEDEDGKLSVGDGMDVDAANADEENRGRQATRSAGRKKQAAQRTNDEGGSEDEMSD